VIVGGKKSSNIVRDVEHGLNTPLDRGYMKIVLRETGGVFGSDRTVDIAENRLRVSDRARGSLDRELTEGETQKVGEVARRLVAAGGSLQAGAAAGVSDSTLRELEIGDGAETRKYSVRSGEPVPDEFWELIGTLGEVADGGGQA
jgi:hypothetical protein